MKSPFTLFCFMIFHMCNLSAQDVPVTIRLKNASTISGNAERGLSKTVLRQSELVLSGMPAYSVKDIHSFVINEKEYYEVIEMEKGRQIISRVLFEGAIELYQVHDFNSGSKRYYMYDTTERKYVQVTAKNLRGTYSYLFRKCEASKSDTNRKYRKNFNDISMMYELGKYHTCMGLPFAYRKEFEKPAVYVGVLGGINIYLPKFAGERNDFYKASNSKRIGYQAGMSVQIEAKKRYVFGTNITYANKQSVLHAEKVLTSPVRFTRYFDGTVKTEEIGMKFYFDCNFLKTAFTPYAGAGLSFASQFNSGTTTTEYTSLSLNPVTAYEDNISNFSIGANFRIGVRYKIKKLVLIYAEEEIDYSLSNFGYVAGGFNAATLSTHIGLAFCLNGKSLHRNILTK